MDLVGNDTLQVLTYKFEIKQNERWDMMLDYLRKTPQVRDVVVPEAGHIQAVKNKELRRRLTEFLQRHSGREPGLAAVPRRAAADLSPLL